MGCRFDHSAVSSGNTHTAVRSRPGFLAICHAASISGNVNTSGRTSSCTAAANAASTTAPNAASGWSVSASRLRYIHVNVPANAKAGSSMAAR